MACKINHGDDGGGAYYAATPPLECKRISMNQMATKTARHGKTLKLSFMDLRKAFFNGIPKPRIYLMLPPELALPTGTVVFVVKCAYGT